MTLNDLERIFEEAIDKYLMIGVAVKLPNLEHPEIIINPQENFIEKLNYYKNSYNDDLRLKVNNDIYIVGAYAADYADEIYCMLRNN